LYGSFDKPVYTLENNFERLLENHNFKKMIQALPNVKKLTDFNVKLSELGTNEEHISLHLYTITTNNERTIVIDVYISNFKNWTPEPKGSYEYPEKALVENGPYYMELAYNLESIFNIPASKYSFIEYNAESDMVIYSGEYSFKSFLNI